MNLQRLTNLDQIVDQLERTVDASPADFTELVWIERRACRAASQGALLPPRLERTLMVRIHERGRCGYHRLDGSDLDTAADAVRHALAQARTNPVVRGWRPQPGCPLPPLGRDQLFDPDLARLHPEAAEELLAGSLDAAERAQMEWVEGRVAVVNSVGLRRRLRTTCATVFATSGRGAEAGGARLSARQLQAAHPAAAMELARGRRAGSSGDEITDESFAGPLVLAPEAAAALLGELGRFAAAAMASGLGATFLEPRLGGVLPAVLEAYDDGSDPAGLPFPFDLKGSAKNCLPLIREGRVQPLPVAASTTEDRLGCFAAGGGEIHLSNLFLGAGERGEEELLDAAEDGIWITALRPLACYPLSELRLRARARGLRRIRRGRLAEALPDRPLEDLLASLLSRVAEAGRDRLSGATGDGIFGGLTAPALRLESRRHS